MPSCKRKFAQQHRSANTQDTVALTHNMPSHWQNFSQHVVALTQHCTARRCANIQHAVALTHLYNTPLPLNTTCCHLTQFCTTHYNPLVLHNTPSRKHSFAKTRRRANTTFHNTMSHLHTPRCHANTILHNASSRFMQLCTTCRGANTQHAVVQTYYSPLGKHNHAQRAIAPTQLCKTRCRAYTQHAIALR